MPTWPEIDNPTRYIGRIEFWRARDDRLVIHVYPTAAFSNEIDVGEDAILLEAMDDGSGMLQGPAARTPTSAPFPTGSFPPPVETGSTTRAKSRFRNKWCRRNDETANPKAQRAGVCTTCF